MGILAKQTKQRRNLRLIAGVRKRLANIPVLALAGRHVTPDQFVRLLESQLELLAQADRLAAQHRAVVAQERELEASLRPMLRGLRATVDDFFGERRVPLADFGYVPHKKTGPKTPDVKAEAAAKSRATRAARHTMGKRQRRRVTGDEQLA